MNAVAVKRHTWDEHDMIRAINSIREKKMGLKKAVKQFNVPKTTLKRYANQTSKTPEECVATRIGRKSILPPALEEELVDYVLELEKRFFGFTPSVIPSMFRKKWLAEGGTIYLCEDIRIFSA
jgi:hypothetical protein